MALLAQAIEQVAEVNRAEWMLEPTEGRAHLLGQIEKLYLQPSAQLTYRELVKQAYQITREDFLNRAEVARTSAEIMFRARIAAARQREINRIFLAQQAEAERAQAARRAAYVAQRQAQIAASYVNARVANSYAQQSYVDPPQRQIPSNASRFDPQNVGFDSRRGYTAPRYGSDRQPGADTSTGFQTEPRRFRDQTGRAYEQPPGSAFARDERTGKQCFVNGAFVHC